MANNDNKNSDSPVLGLVATALFSLIVGFFAAGFLIPKTEAPAPAETVRSTTTKAATKTSEPVAAVDATPAFTQVSVPEYNGKKGTYSFKVEAKAPSGDAILYKLFDKQNKEIASNPDGFFLDVKPSADGGVYYVQAVNSREPSLATALKAVSGFDVKEVAVAKVDKGTLTGKFNTGSYADNFSGAWERTYLAPGCKLRFTGIREGERHPSDIGDICRRINMNTWASVQVTSVSYDSLNHITSMTIDVKYPSE